MSTVLQHARASAHPLTLIVVCTLLYFGIRREVVINRHIDESIVSILDEMKVGRQQYVGMHNETHAKEDKLQATADETLTDVKQLVRRIGSEPTTNR